MGTWRKRRRLPWTSTHLAGHHSETAVNHERKDAYPLPRRRQTEGRSRRLKDWDRALCQDEKNRPCIGLCRPASYSMSGQQTQCRVEPRGVGKSPIRVGHCGSICWHSSRWQRHHGNAPGRPSGPQGPAWLSSGPAFASRVSASDRGTAMGIRQRWNRVLERRGGVRRGLERPAATVSLTGLTVLLTSRAALSAPRDGHAGRGWPARPLAAPSRPGRPFHWGQDVPHRRVSRRLQWLGVTRSGTPATRGSPWRCEPDRYGPGYATVSYHVDWDSRNSHWDKGLSVRAVAGLWGGGADRDRTDDLRLAEATVVRVGTTAHVPVATVVATGFSSVGLSMLPECPGAT